MSTRTQWHVTFSSFLWCRQDIIMFKQLLFCHSDLCSIGEHYIVICECIVHMSVFLMFRLNVQKWIKTPKPRYFCKFSISTQAFVVNLQTVLSLTRLVLNIAPTASCCAHSTDTNINSVNCFGGLNEIKPFCSHVITPQIQEWLWKWICVNNCLASRSLVA